MTYEHYVYLFAIFKLLELAPVGLDYSYYKLCALKLFIGIKMFLYEI